jgi:hypothetical protein
MWVGSLIIRRGYLGLSQSIKVLITIALIHATIKLISFGLITSGVISLADYTAAESEIFGVLPISLEVDNFVRLNVPSDFVFPIVLMLCMISDMGLLRKYLSMTIILLAVIVTYSRYLWLYAALVLFAYYCSTLLKNLTMSDTQKKVGINVFKLLLILLSMAFCITIIFVLLTKIIQVMI